MGDTYTQLYIQLVFAVKGRTNFIQHAWEEELHKYITAVVQNDRHKMLAINMSFTKSEIENAGFIKRAGNNWINKKGFTKGKFEWQSGYGAFSYGKSQIDQVCKYVLNQKTHHAKLSFKDEYKKLLKLFEIDFIDEYLFEFYD